VTNLKHIFESLEREFPQPPVDRIFMPINRQVLEEGADVKEGQEPNWIAVENLKVLNHARDFGLWGGRAKVFEFGANAFVGTEYEKFKSTIGAMANFHISQSSTIFVGTEISSYSTDIMRTRFYGGNRQNYKYLPDGLHRWTDDETEMPQGFSC
jgi:hypothetical protein